ncbi:hypothetical protein EJ03DRAFT_9817, partial [Teratosphaeria nubilosa]
LFSRARSYIYKQNLRASNFLHRIQINFTTFRPDRSASPPTKNNYQHLPIHTDDTQPEKHPHHEDYHHPRRHGGCCQRTPCQHRPSPQHHYNHHRSPRHPLHHHQQSHSRLPHLPRLLLPKLQRRDGVRRPHQRQWRHLHHRLRQDAERPGLQLGGLRRQLRRGQHARLPRDLRLPGRERRMLRRYDHAGEAVRGHHWCVRGYDGWEWVRDVR